MLSIQRPSDLKTNKRLGVVANDVPALKVLTGGIAYRAATPMLPINNIGSIGSSGVFGKGVGEI